jgi:FkbM family methyltransferase
MILKQIYKILPFKREIFTVIKRVLPLPKSLYQHLYFSGVFKVKVNSKRSFYLMHFGAKVENEIFWKGLYGLWERQSLKIWTALSEECKYIFDIGANTGVYAILAKTVNPQSSVYAFEPVNRVFRRLIQNINLNGYEIHAHNIGLSNFDGSGIIYDPGTEHIYSVTINKNLLAKNQFATEVRVDVCRFDTWFEKLNIPSVDLVKIDVETHEPEVIEGMLGLIMKFQPTIIIEVLNESIAAKLNILLGKMDYVIYAINENKGLSKINKISKSPDFNILLCTAKTERNLITKGIIPVK